jgi:hypothetical protein
MPAGWFVEILDQVRVPGSLQHAIQPLAVPLPWIQGAGAKNFRQPPSLALSQHNRRDGNA